MRVYYHDNEPGDCRLPHLSNHVLSPSHLTQLSILYYTIPPSFPYSSSCVETTAQTRNYANRDEITVSPSAMGATYEDRIKMFFDEHMHEDEEIRWIQDGEGYFDVRDADDWWVRIEAEVGILLVLPAGIYHRFTVDEGNYIKAVRLFQNSPKWAALNRGVETEKNPFRKAYVNARRKGFPAFGNEEIKEADK